MGNEPKSSDLMATNPTGGLERFAPGDLATAKQMHVLCQRRWEISKKQEIRRKPLLA